jgi:hypothetical protein
VSSVAEFVGAEKDAVVEAEAAGLGVCAHSAYYVILVQIASQFRYLVTEKAYDGRVL